MQPASKRPLGVNVYAAAQGRIAYVFDTFPHIYISFSGGKDSTVMLHMVMDEAIKRGRKVGLLFIDLEAQYKLTIDHVQECFDLYADHVEPYWVALPMVLRNAVSQYDPRWTCWDPEERDMWVREAPDIAITDPASIPFFRSGMEFEEFIKDFGDWHGGGELTACFVGIRSDESLNRYRTIASTKKRTMEGRQWTTHVTGETFNVYPIYDWRTRDVWIYHARNDRPHNHLYDRMHQAGLTIHQMRICQPYGDDQRRGLWLFHVIEPETWAKVVARVNGANQGALYARESGNITGMIKITKPVGHTWESFARLLLASMPAAAREHYGDKIAVFLRWWQIRGYLFIPDAQPPRLESGIDGPRRPSWRRICKALLRNDYWCKGLSFSQTKSGDNAQLNYRTMMAKRKNRWVGLPEIIQ